MKTASYIKPFSEEKYEAFLALVKGENLKAPCRKRKQFAGFLGQYYRYRICYTVRTYDNGETKLFFNGLEVVKASNVKRIVLEQFKEMCGSGYKPLHKDLCRRYAGISERSIRMMLLSSTSYQKQYAKFDNKPPLKVITAERVAQRWQIDTVNMRKQEVKWRGKSYKYILTVVDVYSRYTILRPLESKHASCVERALKEIFKEHGMPEKIQMDNGTEFRGCVEDLLRHKNVRVVRGRPYHPQTQGKVERTNKIIRQKIAYLTNKKGFNWAKDLSKVMHSINNSPRRCIGYYTPFAAYFCRSKDVKLMHDKINLAKQRYQRRLEKFSQSIYNVNERVLVKYPTTTKRIPTKHHVLKAKVIDRDVKRGLYKLIYKSPNGLLSTEWVSVQCITSLTADAERNRPKNRVERVLSHKEEFYIPLTKSENLMRLDQFRDGSVTVASDPKGDGNCQFHAVSHQLSMIGIHRSATGIRSEAVRHLRTYKGFYHAFVSDNYENYLQSMEKNGTYGDHLTLIAIAREYNCQILIVSCLGPSRNIILSNSGRFENDLPCLTLCYLPEGNGEHYVSLQTKCVTKFVEKCGLVTDSEVEGAMRDEIGLSNRHQTGNGYEETMGCEKDKSGVGSENELETDTEHEQSTRDEQYQACCGSDYEHDADSVHDEAIGHEQILTCRGSEHERDTDSDHDETLNDDIDPTGGGSENELETNSDRYETVRDEIDQTGRGSEYGSDTDSDHVETKSYELDQTDVGSEHELETDSDRDETVRDEIDQTGGVSEYDRDTDSDHDETKRYERDQTDVDSEHELEIDSDRDETTRYDIDQTDVGSEHELGTDSDRDETMRYDIDQTDVGSEHELGTDSDRDETTRYDIDQTDVGSEHELGTESDRDETMRYDIDQTDVCSEHELGTDSDRDETMRDEIDQTGGESEQKLDTDSDHEEAMRYEIDQTGGGNEHELENDSDRGESMRDEIDQSRDTGSGVTKDKHPELYKLRKCIEFKRNSRRCRDKSYGRYSWNDLPSEIRHKIIQFCLNDDPSIRYILAMVSESFNQVLRLIPYPRLHIGSHDEPIPKPVSVRYLMTHFGSGSGLVMKIREMIPHKEWANAWLRLRQNDFNWHDVIGIWYRRKQY